MFLDHAQTHRSNAAAPALAKISRDQETAPQKLRPLLAYIHEHLFDPELTVGRLKRACGIRDNSLATYFHSAIGLKPSAYITEGRLSTAARLLRGTDLPIWLIGELVGYSSIHVFSRAFRRWAGQSARSFRKSVDSTEQLRDPLADEVFQLDYWRKAFAGDLAADEARSLIGRLQHLYPTAERSAVPAEAAVPVATSVPRLSVDGSEYEAFMAEQLWDSIRELPGEEQRSMVRDRIAFRSPALFDLLRQKSRDEGRSDRSRGVWLAELALESLSGSAEYMGPELPDLKARGWAWLGNARRIAGDLPGSELAFLQAETQWAAGDLRDPLVRAELYDLKAALRMYQRKFAEAIELESFAVPVFRLQGEKVALTKALLTRAITHNYAGNPAAAIPDAEEALGLAEAGGERYLQMSGYTTLVTSLATLERFSEAAALLPLTEEVCRSINSTVGLLQTVWIEGRIREGLGEPEAAERSFVHARSGFLALPDMGFASVVSLDLALLHLGQGRSERAVEVVGEALPLLEALGLQREVLAAVTMLRQAVQTGVLTREILEAARSSVEMARFLQ